MLKILETLGSPSSSLSSVFKVKSTKPQPLPHPIQEDAVKVTLSNAGFIGRLEKHIDDYKKGRGYLSSDVAQELGRKEETASKALAQHGGTLSLLFGTYSTGLSYGQKARFIDGVSRAVATVEQIAKAQEAGSQTQEIIDAYNKTQD